MEPCRVEKWLRNQIGHEAAKRPPTAGNHWHPKLEGQRRKRCYLRWELAEAEPLWGHLVRKGALKEMQPPPAERGTSPHLLRPPGSLQNLLLPVAEPRRKPSTQILRRSLQDQSVSAPWRCTAEQREKLSGPQCLEVCVRQAPSLPNQEKSGRRGQANILELEWHER
jgi:hypothetical protein